MLEGGGPPLDLQFYKEHSTQSPTPGLDKKILSSRTCLTAGAFPHGLPRWLSGKEATCQCRRLGFDPWVGKISWRRAQHPTPALFPGESQGQRRLVVCNPSVAESWTRLKQLSTHAYFPSQGCLQVNSHIWKSLLTLHPDHAGLVYFRHQCLWYSMGMSVIMIEKKGEILVKGKTEGRKAQHLQSSRKCK